MIASELFAKIHGVKCVGHSKCHWCGSPCDGKHFSDDPVIPHIKHTSLAQYPANPWICEGCFLYRGEGNRSISTLSGAIRDNSRFGEVSWLMTGTRFTLIDLPADSESLFKLLIDPSNTLCLSLMTQSCKLRCEDKRHRHTKQCLLNRIDLAYVNYSDNPRLDAYLEFTVDNIPHKYIPWELEEAVKSGSASGTEPGTQVLVKLLGPLDVKSEEKKGTKGRPRKDYEALEDDRAVGKPRKR